MKTSRKLRHDVSNNFLYKCLEKKQKKSKFKSGYQSEPQTAVAGTKHTITTDTNRILHRKLVSKPLPNSFQNPLSRRGENRRGIDGRFIQIYLCPHSKQKTWTKKKPKQKRKRERERERESTPVREISAEQTEESFDTNNIDRTRKAKTC